MTDNDQSAQPTTVAPARQGWVKPEITSFAAAVEAQKGSQANDGLGTNLS